MKLGPALKLKAILASRLGVQCQKCGGQNASTPAAVSSNGGDNSLSPPSSVNGSESRRLSHSAAGVTARRSVSPPQVNNKQQQQQLSNDSFALFRAKMESLSPNYGDGHSTGHCEGSGGGGMIATVTMTAAHGACSTPNDTSDEASPNVKDIPMKALDLLTGADR